MLGDPLTPAELQRIFDEDIRPYYFPDNLAPNAPLRAPDIMGW